MSRRSLLVRVALVGALFNLGGGACAGGCCESSEVAHYDRAYASGRAHETESFVFQRPITEVWPELLGLLKEHGYALDAPSPVEGRTLETAFTPAPLGGAYRFLIRVIRVDAGHYRVSLEKQYRFEADGGLALEIEPHDSSDRERTDVGWALIERAEPARASEIDARVKARAERAGEVGRRYDRGCITCADIVDRDRPPTR